MDEIVCTNLKYWKVEKKKSSGGYIGFLVATGVGRGLGWALGAERRGCNGALGLSRFG